MTLHSLACHGWAESRCAVVYRVRETGTSNTRSIYNVPNTGEAVDNVESPTAGLSRFPERSGRLRVHRREVR